MSLRQYSKFDSEGRYLEWYFNSSESSIVNGRVDMRKQQPHTFEHIRDIVRNRGTIREFYLTDPASYNFLSSEVVGRMEQAALAKFNGQLRKGNAELGMTLATWKQSRDMIVDRFKRVNPVISAAEYRLRNNRKARMSLQRKFSHNANVTAGNVLEVEFGWRPMFSDIYAALFTAMQDAIPPTWVVGRQRQRIFDSVYSPPGDYFQYQRLNHGKALVTVAASVSVTNPNAWLLNRMGLINPATVVWDAIPWSFVVNMFVNVSAMINSLTNYVGLSVNNISTTTSYQLSRGEFSWLLSDESLEGHIPSFSSSNHKYRRRSIGAMPQVKWDVRVPKFSWELALIAASLVTQKVTRINRLLLP